MSQKLSIHLQAIVVCLDEQDDTSIVAAGHGIEVDTFAEALVANLLAQAINFCAERPDRPFQASNAFLACGEIVVHSL